MFSKVFDLCIFKRCHHIPSILVSFEIGMEEILKALKYGNSTEDNYESFVKGVVSEAFISELLSENPTDKDVYNKMTKYFTINVEHEQRKFCSAHYGTEMYLSGLSDEDISFFKSVMDAYTENDFSITMDE